MSGAFRMKDRGALSKVVWIRAHIAGIAAGSRLWTDRDLRGQSSQSETCRQSGMLCHVRHCAAGSSLCSRGDRQDALVVADGKSGVSGAGRHPKQETHFCEVNENLRAYGVLKHRHTPEMLACLPGASADNFVFTPHLIPITRGILTRLYSSPRRLFRARRAWRTSIRIPSS